MEEVTFWGLGITAWTAVLALITAALVVVAVVTARFALTQIKEGRQVARDTHRAYVSADFEPHPAIFYVIEFVIRNTGRSAATDIRFDWDDPKPVRTVEFLGGVKGHAFLDARVFSGIPTLAPGREIRFMFDSTLERFNRQDVPGIFKLKITYRDVFGTSHSDRFVLDAELQRGAHFTGVKTVDDVGKALEQIASTLKSSGIAKGDLVVVTEARADRVAREEAQYAEFKARQEESGRTRDGGDDHPSV